MLCQLSYASIRLETTEKKITSVAVRKAFHPRYLNKYSTATAGFKARAAARRKFLACAVKR